MDPDAGTGRAEEMVERPPPGGITQHPPPPFSHHLKHPVGGCVRALFTICRLCCAVVPCPRATRLPLRRDMVHSESRLRDPGSCATQVAQILSERRFMVMPEDAVFTAA